MRSDSRFLIAAGFFGGVAGIGLAVALSAKPYRNQNPARLVVASPTTETTTPIGVTTASTQATTQPIAPSNSAGSATEATASLTPTTVANVAPMAPESHLEREIRTVAWSTPNDSTTADVRCTNGDAIACLELGELQGTDPTDKKVSLRRQSYFERAFSILVLKCHRRDPDACVVIARMHHLSRGVGKDREAELALVSRARDLCRTKPGRSCQTLNEP